jgi:hypothetical protein
MSYLGDQITKGIKKARGEATYDDSGLREWSDSARQAKQDSIKSSINRGTYRKSKKSSKS